MDNDKRYTQQEIIEEYYQSIYKKTEVPEAIKNTCNSQYNDFIKLFKLDSVRANKKHWEGYKFSEKSKTFLVWLFQNYTTTNLKRIRKGQIDFDNLADYRKMYFGAIQIAQDFNVSEEAKEELRATVYNIGNYPRIVCNSFSERLGDTILDSTGISDADRMACLERIYTKVLSGISDVVCEMADVRRGSMQEAIDNYMQFGGDRIELMQQDVWLAKQLENDDSYQDLMKKIHEIECPQGTKGSRQITTQRKEIAKIQKKLEAIEAQYKEKCGYRDAAEEEEELNIEKICRNMLSSDECLNQALENVKKEYAETIELMD